MSWLAFDIGGANLKMADGQGFAHSVAFPLWKHPEQLPTALQELLSTAPPADSLAITMTGELADCFETKAEGVSAILDAVEQVAGERDTSVYLCDGRLAPIKVARSEPLLAAASNWHVLASYVSRFCNNSTGLLIDIGSTTSDLIPLGQSGPDALGMTDPDRLASGELVYTGVQRSPVCAVVPELPWRGKPCPVAQEFFATTQDAYLLLDKLTEEPDCLDTADGRSCTKPNAHARLARSICADTSMFSMSDAVLAAEEICEAQLRLLTKAAQQVLARWAIVPSTIVVSGQGEFLASRLIKQLQLDCEVVQLSKELGPEGSRAACAHALAVLAAERAST